MFTTYTQILNSSFRSSSRIDRAELLARIGQADCKMVKVTRGDVVVREYTIKRFAIDFVKTVADDAVTFTLYTESALELPLILIIGNAQRNGSTNEARVAYAIESALETGIGIDPEYKTALFALDSSRAVTFFDCVVTMSNVLSIAASIAKMRGVIIWTN